MSIARRSVRNFSVQLGGFVVAVADRIILTGLLIRSWGLEGFSDWATLIAATGLLAMTDLGFQLYLGNLLTSARIRGRTRAFDRIVALGLSFYTAIGIVILIGLVGLVLLFDVEALLELHGHGLVPVFILLAAQQTFRVVRSAVIQIYRGMGEYHRFIWTDTRASGAGILIGAAAVALGAQPLMLAAIYLATELLFGTGWAILHIRSRFAEIPLRWRRPSAHGLKQVGRGLSWYGVYLVMSFTVQNLPVLIIAWLGLSGPALVSFVVQRTLVNFSRTLGFTFSLATGVELAAEAQSPNSGPSQTGVAVLARANAALAGLVTAGLLLFGADIIGLWTGHRNLGSPIVLAWLLLPLFVIAPAVPLQMLCIYGQRIRPQAIAMVAQTLIAIPGAVIAGTIYGIVGVVAALAIGEILAMGILAPLITARPLGIRYWPLVRGCAIVSAGAVIWAGLVGLGVRAVIEPSGLSEVIVELALWAAFGAFPVGWLALPQQVRQLLLTFARTRIYGRRFSR